MAWLEECVQRHGGQDRLFQDLIELFQVRSDGALSIQQRGGSNSLAVLLEGHTGCGKGHLARTFAEASGYPWRAIDLLECLKDESCNGLQRFKAALGPDAGRILILEDVELILGPGSPATKAFRAVLEETIISSRAESFRLILAISSASHLLGDRSLFSRCHRVAVSMPEQRLAILRIIAKDLVANGHLGPEDLGRIARLTHGYSVADLEGLKTMAASVALQKASPGRFDLAAFQEALLKCRPSLMAPYYRPVPKQRLDDLVGLDDIIERLRDLVLLPLQAEAACERFQVGLPRGILLHGATGTGKTHLALGLIAAAGLNFIQAEATQLRSKYVGESERRLAELFQRAREAAPAVLLLDQVDGLVGKRGTSDDGSGGSSSMDRLVTCFLTEMDGIGAKGGPPSRLLVIGVTSRLGRLDPAMMRPGRLGIHLGLPASLPRDARRLMVREKTRVQLRLAPEELEAVLDATEGYNGARLDWLLRQCALRAVDEGVVTFKYFKEELNLP